MAATFIWNQIFFIHFLEKEKLSIYFDFFIHFSEHFLACFVHFVWRKDKTNSTDLILKMDGYLNVHLTSEIDLNEPADR